MEVFFFSKKYISICIIKKLSLYVPRADRSGRAALLPERNTYAAANAVYSLGEGQWGGECRTRKKAPSEHIGRGFFPVF